MRITELEAQLINEDFAIDCCAFRNKGEITFSTPEESRNFLIKFLVLETTAGVDYEDEEMMSAYEQIKTMLKQKNIISSNKLPYHRKKKRPSKEVMYFLDGCKCQKGASIVF